MPRVLPLLLLCAAVHAAEVAQFRAEDFGAEWRAARGGAALVAVHPATNGWAAAFEDRGGVSFSATNGVASPLEFDPATTGAVAHALIVADCTEARPWSALLDAPVGAALAPRAFDRDIVRFATSNCLGAVSVSVDGVAGQDTYRAHYPLPDGHFDVSCRWRDSHSSLLVSDAIRCDPTSCRPGQTNFVGAGWTSTHNPTNAADHAPGIVETDVHFGPLCPVAHDVDVKLGWTHNTAILWIRNLVRIVTGDPMDDETDHCISLPFSQTGEIDLYSYLDGVCLSYRERFVFKVNGRSLTGHTIHMSDYKTDNDLKPSVLHVSFSFGESREMDRMWIVLYSSNLKTGYDSWKTKFSGLTWTTSLPPVYPNIALSTNSNGTVSLVEQDYPGWKRPHAISSFLHHDAVYEMRSESVGIHGHQATYRADGTVIETTLAAGTADFSHPLSTHAHWPTIIQDDHYVNDVVPFLRALSLDGNPGIYNKRYIPTNLTRPCLYQGTNINEYILRRPTFPSGKH